MVVLVIEYDGTAYHGSQWQANAPTIQGEMEKALQQLTGEKIRIKAAGRTDAGVHARGQVIGFTTASDLPLTAFRDGMNHYLPRDIAVLAAYRAPDGFDVRRRAVNREYRYTIRSGATRSPLRDAYAWPVAGELDISAMNQACQHLIGRHDLASFVASAQAIRDRRTVREVFKAEITGDGDMIYFDIVANAFLPHQVRNTVGALVRVGQGRLTPAEFGEMVEAAQPGLAGPTAPAAGLCLMRVNYAGPFEGEAR